MARDYAQQAVRFNPSFSTGYLWLGQAQVHSGDYQQGERNIQKAFELSPADPDLSHFHVALYFACLGQGKYEEALQASDKALRRHPDQGFILGFRAAVLGHLQRPEAKAALERYLALRPNLKTRNDYRRIFIRNSALAESIIEGLVKAGWELER
jgi:tetratricopeptide (TPR) repeat protein